MVDQHHPGCFGYAGHPLVRTPHIDALARKSVTCTRAYVANPLCMPSRASFFTGLTPRGHRVRMNGIGLDPQTPIITDALRKAGYSTHAAGKLHFRPTYTPNGVALNQVNAAEYPEAKDLWTSGRIKNLPLPYYGFASVDYANGHGDGSFGHYLHWLDAEHKQHRRLFYDRVTLEPPTPAYNLFNRKSYKWALPAELHPMAWIADRAIDYLKQPDRRDKPFFLFCSFQDPHSPFAPPAPWCYRYQPKDVAPAKRTKDEFDRLPPHFRAQYETTLTTQGNNGQPMKATDPYREECAAHYFGLIEMLDSQIGRVLQSLESSGLAGNTVVILTADHGEALGDHGMWGKGPYHFDSVIRVPFLVSSPGRFRAGTTHSGVVSILDAAPTILELAGVPIPQGVVPKTVEAPKMPPPWPGRSLVSMLASRRDDASRTALVEEDEDYLGFRMRTLVTERYRLTAYSGKPYGELFDLREDPNEFRNLWDSPMHKALREDLRAALLDKIMETDLALPRQTGRA